MQQAEGLLVEGFHGTQQGRLVVQRLAGEGDEDRGDAQHRAAGLLLDKGRRGHIPGRIAAGVVGGAETAGGEGRRVGLAHDQLLARQLEDGLTSHGRRQERVVLLGGDTGEGLEPVGVMGGAFADGPILHGVGHDVGRLHAQLTAVLQHVHDLGKFLGG